MATGSKLQNLKYKYMKIVHEKEKCIGCGACASICSKYFEMENDGKAGLKNSKINPETGNEELEVEEVGCANEASSSCPVEVIHIEE